ncbi:MAG TPA: hypothetical protein PLD59_16520 [Tepidisphaeraceae bacterium]|nr:hypothetical protein [Tepidisphaeraceae bacterium]
MAKVTIGFSAALILLGVGAYLATGMRSFTALIPAFAGILLLVCGLVALKPALRKHAMHGAVLIAILGFAGSVPGVMNLIRLATQGTENLTAEQRVAMDVKDDQVMLTGGNKIRPVASQVQAGMAGLLFPYIVLCIKSFIDARRARNLLAA